MPTNPNVASSRVRWLSPEQRRAIQASDEPVAALCARHGVDPKTVRRWRSRSSPESRRSGRPAGAARVLGPAAEALIGAIREVTRLPLDDCLYALQVFMPGLTRASLHRCLSRQGLSRLPSAPAGVHEPGAFDVRLLELGAGPEPLRLFIAVDRASKFLFTELQEARTAPPAADVLRRLVATAPMPVRIVFTEPHGLDERAEREVVLACAALGVRHGRSGVGWARERVRDLRARVEARLVGTPPGDAFLARRERFNALVARYNGECRLKSLGGMTPLAYAQARSSAEVGVSERRRGSSGAPRGRKRAVADERDQRSTREAILEAARALLARVGPDGLSLSEVARVAGVNRGTAYHHFKSRGQLVAATVAWTSQQLMNAVFEPLPSSERGEGRSASEVARRLSSFAIRNPEVSQAWLLQVLSSPDPSQDSFWREWVTSGDRLHGTSVAQPDIDTEVLGVMMLAGAFLWPVWARAKRKETDDLQALADRFSREQLRLAMYGILKPEHFPELAAELRSEAPPSATPPPPQA